RTGKRAPRPTRHSSVRPVAASRRRRRKSRPTTAWPKPSRNRSHCRWTAPRNTRRATRRESTTESSPTFETPHQTLRVDTFQLPLEHAEVGEFLPGVQRRVQDVAFVLELLLRHRRGVVLA